MRGIVAFTLLALVAGSAGAEPVNCQKQIIKNLLKFKKTYLKALGKCADAKNLGKLANGVDCPDATAQLKIDTVKTKVATKIGLSCPDPDLATLGFPTDCAFQTGSGIEATCAALPVTNAGEFATCLMCWKGAELSGYMAILYASHAVEICGGALDGTSPACNDLPCMGPPPDQRNLGDTGENDCQKAVGKNGIKLLVSIEKVLEKCGLLGNDRLTCLNSNQATLDKARLKFETVVKNKCGNRDPVLSTPYCCKTTAPMQACVMSTSREDCEAQDPSNSVVEGKICDGTLHCDSLMGGGQKLTWWNTCSGGFGLFCEPNSVTTLDEMLSCIEAFADERAQALLCIQFPSGWDCPPPSPSGAFLD